MPFFPDNVIKSGFTIQDRDWAMTLCDALQTKGVRLGVKVHLSSWSTHFRKLRQTFNDDLRIDKVLEWYCQHINAEFVPIAHSAAGFRNKFPAIEMAMVRDLKKNPDVEVSDRAKKLAQWLSRFKWPMGSGEKLPVVIQASLDAYFVFMHKIKAFIRLPRFGKDALRVQAFANELTYKFGHADTFMEQWFGTVFKQVRKWKTWSGDLTQYIFTPHHKLFKAFGMEYAQRYSGSAELWFKLMRELYGQ